MQNQSLSSGLDKLARISKLRVSYTIPQVSKYTKITVEKGSRTVAATLDLLLSKTNLTYTLKGNNVVIIEKNDRTADISPEQNGQPGVITGNVTKADGEVLVGVTILVKETDGKGTITDSKGNFSLALTGSEETLVFSQVGLKKQEVNVNGRSRVNVKMEDESYALEQVVVTGIFNKKLAAYTGAAVTVTAKELEMSGTRNLITSLRNIDPSFNILDNNLYGSDPNRTPEIQIRGNSSVPNISELKDETSVGLNTPLVIIDGFQSTLQRLIDMNQYEIESITILKDASATAIYGSRGANGVVVVKTKAPVEGKLRITYNGRVNFEAPDLTGYNLLGAREKLELEYKTGLYNNARAESDLPLKKYYNYLLNEVNSGVSTDWLALPLQLGLGQKHNLRLEGGNEQFRYSASAQLNNVNGVMKGSARNNFNGTIKLSYDFKNITFANELAVGFTNTAESPYGSFGEYALMNPYWRPYDKNGDINKYLGNPGTTDYVGIWSSLPTNPMYNSTINTFDKQNNNLITNTTSVDWNIFKDLNLVAKLGLSKGMNQRDRFRPADHTAFSNYSTDDILRKGDYLYITGNQFSYDGSVTLFYSKQINKHSFNYGLDYNIFETSNSSYSFLSEGFSNENFDFPSMALQYAKNGKPSGDESLVRS
ncbi:MAG TPA: TonB-dependent receptor plug domain-containing protein, partial [Paludibacter sp.]|nr:TonB-dependent receptor plug domain-containing protein [Paludibacter sp.]